MDRNKLSRWQVTTDKFEITYPHEAYDDGLPFRVATIKSYSGEAGKGRMYQLIYLSEEVITLSEEEIIKVLSQMMQDGIDYQISMGNIQEQGRGLNAHNLQSRAGQIETE